MNVMSPQTLPPEAAAAEWVAALAEALERQDATAATALFLPDGHWRDLLAFGWEIETTSGRAALEARLRDALPLVRPRGVRLAPHRTAPRLMPDPGAPGGMRAWILLTALQELRGHPDRAGRQHTAEKDYSRDFGGPNWADKREAARAYADHDPAVIVVGCGQAGLGIAARLGVLGIDTLVVDREERVGDN